MDLTERVAKGESIQLPTLAPTPATMTSQLDREPVSEVKERYSSRFSIRSESAVPEPLATDHTANSNSTDIPTVLLLLRSPHLPPHQPAPL